MTKHCVYEGVLEKIHGKVLGTSPSQLTVSWGVVGRWKGEDKQHCSGHIYIMPSCNTKRKVQQSQRCYKCGRQIFLKLR